MHADDLVLYDGFGTVEWLSPYPLHPLLLGFMAISGLNVDTGLNDTCSTHDHSEKLLGRCGLGLFGRRL